MMMWLFAVAAIALCTGFVLGAWAQARRYHHHLMLEQKSDYLSPENPFLPMSPEEVDALYPGLKPHFEEEKKRRVSHKWKQ